MKILFSFFLFFNLLFSVEIVSNQASGVTRQMTLTFTDLLWRYEPSLIEKNLKSSVKNYDLLALVLYDSGLKEYHTVWSNKEEIVYEKNDKHIKIPNIESMSVIKQVLKHEDIQIGELFIYLKKPKSILNLTLKEKTFIKENPKIKVTNEMDFPPYDFVQNGKPSGYNIDLLKLLEKKIGVEFEYINNHTWTELLELLKKGKIDLAHAVKETPKRKEYAVFSNPYRRLKTHFVTLEETKDIKSIEELFGKTIAIGKSWSQEEFFEKNYPQIKLLKVNNLLEMLEAVSLGKAYATLGNKDVLKFAIKKNSLRDLKIGKWFKKIDDNNAYTHHFMAKKSQPELISIINKALLEISVKELDELEKKWFGADSKKNKNQLKFSIEEQIYLDKTPSFKICSSSNYKPIEWIDEKGKYQGLLAEYMKNIMDKIGHNMQLIETNSLEQTINMLKNKQCDFVPFFAQNNEKPEGINFTKSYEKLDVVIATRKEQIYLQNINNLKKSKIAVVENSIYQNILIKEFPNLNIVKVKDLNQGLQLVKDGKVLGIVDSLISLAYSIQQNRMIDIKISGHIGEPINLAIGVRDNEDLIINILNRALVSITNLEKQNIANKWIKVEFEQKIDYTLVWKIVLGSFFVISIIILWNRKLSRLNKKIAKANSELELQKKEIERLSNTDQLTNLANRRYLDNMMDNEFRRVERYKRAFSIIIIDIDYFKKVNDKFGHDVGDTVLNTFSQVLKSNIRKSDILGRWGGEEFLLICPETSSKQAVELAELLRMRIEETIFPIVKHKTASFGITTYKSGDCEKSILKRADRALYYAKENGRNQIKEG